jgi:hypothetical protein
MVIEYQSIIARGSSDRIESPDTEQAKYQDSVKEK